MRPIRLLLIAVAGVALLFIMPSVSAATGDVTEIDNVEAATVRGAEPVMVAVADNIYVGAYSGDSIDGYVTTFDVSDSGILGASIDNYEFDDANCTDPSIIRLAQGYYAVAYTGIDSDGWLEIINILDNGTIVGEVDNYEFDTAICRFPKLTHIDDNIYAVAYDRNVDGYVTTLDIQENGGIVGQVDNLAFDAGRGVAPDMAMRSDNIYTIAYDGLGSDGWMATIEILDNGTISDTVIDTYEFNTTQGINNEILCVDGSVCVIAYTGAGTDGWLTTVNILENGTIVGGVDNYEFDPVTGQYPEIAHIHSTTYAIVYDGVGGDGFIQTITIHDNGDIGPSLDNYEFNEVDCDVPFVMELSLGTIIVLYNDVDDDAWLVTLSIEIGRAWQEIEDWTVELISPTAPTISTPEYPATITPMTLFMIADNFTSNNDFTIVVNAILYLDNAFQLMFENDYPENIEFENVLAMSGENVMAEWIVRSPAEAGGYEFYVEWWCVHDNRTFPPSYSDNTTISVGHLAPVPGYDGSFAIAFMAVCIAIAAIAAGLRSRPMTTQPT